MQRSLINVFTEEFQDRNEKYYVSFYKGDNEDITVYMHVLKKGEEVSIYVNLISFIF